MNTRNHPGAKPKHIPSPLIAALFAAVLFLSSCSNDPIFAAIEDEVELKDPSVRGTITSLVAVGGVGGDLYVTNGRIYKRTGGVGDWNKIGMPDYRCAEVATDGSNLYGLFQNEKYETTGVYRFTGSWTAVTGVTGIKKIGSGNTRIYAFTGSGSSWNAYVTNTVTTLAAVPGATGIAFPVGSYGDYFATTAEVYLNTGAAQSFPGTSIKRITGFTSNLFVLTSAGTIYPYSTPTWGTPVTASVSTPATGIAYLDVPATTTDLLLVSGAAGYGEVTVNAGVLGSAQSPGSTSSSSIPPTAKSQYESSIEQWNLTSIFAVAGASSYDIYAGVMDTKYDGLWGYHSADSSPEWNRE